MKYNKNRPVYYVGILENGTQVQRALIMGLEHVMRNENVTSCNFYTVQENENGIFEEVIGRAKCIKKGKITL